MKPALIASLFVLLIIPLAGLAATPQYEEGTHYIELTIPVENRDENKIEVTEFFSYGCIHCYNFEPILSAWQETLAPDVDFIRIPATFNDAWLVLAQTYYTAEAMDVTKKIHTPLFEAIHSERRRLDNPTEMAMFFAEFGIDPIAFAKVYKSFGVRAKVQQASSSIRAVRLSAVPTLVVNGKYRVESQPSGGFPEMLKIVNFLVKKERSAKAT